MKAGTAGEKFLPNSRRRQRKKLTSNYRRQERERVSNRKQPNYAELPGKSEMGEARYFR